MKRNTEQVSGWSLIIVFLLFAGLISMPAVGLEPSASAQIDRLTVGDATYMVLGLSRLDLKGEERALVGIQVDRGVRDIFWKESRFDIRVPPNRKPSGEHELVPYMEGARAGELVRWASVEVVPLTPGLAVKKADGLYYGSDGEGNYPFMIFQDKIDYPTVTFQRNGEEEMAVIPDTHGFNAVVSPALALHKLNPLRLVIACMDSPDKANAALFLAKKGIACYAPCDRFTNILMGYKQRYGMTTPILGSAPVWKSEVGAVIGGQPVLFDLKEPIVAQYTDKMYPDQYCDAPSRYLRALQRVYQISLNVTEVTAAVGETGLLVTKAEQLGANVIAARIYNQDDYEPLKKWMEKDQRRRLILLHSAAYEFGIQMFREFPTRTTFGDLDPKFL
ncbi:MAG TPA: hypothetical protein PLC07_01515 [Bacillota bacterium]|nr:hypothetical protein [Bacillota bacterium]HPT88378.1 hypothetical protein [Bacillota bacterium]